MKKEIKEVKEVKEQRADAFKVAAFFDLDGTLIALPSMEQRFFRILRYRKEIPQRNYLLWLKEAARLAPLGIREMLQGNKTYLRDVQKINECGGSHSELFPPRKSNQQDTEQQSAFLGCEPSSPHRDPRLPIPAFFAQGVDRVAWHARQGHAIILLSGTLEPLAKDAAKNLEAELAARGVVLSIRVCATRLEEKDGRWTGNVLGEVMRGQAKARAARRLAAEQGFDLPECFAYGDSAADAWLLAAVGRPAAVNPSIELMRIARTQGWPVLRWSESQDAADKSWRSGSRKRRGGENKGVGTGDLESEERDGLDEGQFFNAVTMGTKDQGSLG